MAETGSAPQRRCRTCDRPIPSFAPGGHCPHCLLRSAPVAGAAAAGAAAWDSRYSILKELGEGGFGKVFLAEQHEPVRRKVALKVIKPGMGTREVVARFEAERQTLASLDHTNIAKIYDAGETADGQPAIAMEFVPGVPVTQFASDERLELKERLGLFVQICNGVEHAHLHGIIHRDLKPGNLLAFREADGRASVRIIDFGIAKATRQGPSDATLITLQPGPLGTLAYMSPEQAEGCPDVDARTDVYSLGAVLYELLSGSAPFERSGTSWGEMLSQICAASTTRPSKKLAETREIDVGWKPGDLRGDLDWIVLAALRKERDERYQSVGDLKRDLSAYLQGRAVEARPPSKRYLLKKLIARHRVTSAALVTAAIALVAGTVASTLMAFHASDARRTAEQFAAVAAQQREESQQRFSHSDYLQACELLGDDEFESGIAHLCRALRTDPHNQLAADRLLSALAYTNFLAPVIKEAPHPSRAIAVYLTGRQEFVTVCEEGVAGIWDRQTGERLGDWLDHGGELIATSAMSKDGSLLVSGTHQGTVRVWDLDERTLAFESRGERGDGGVRSVVFTDGRHVATGTDKGWIRVFDFRAGELVWEQESNHWIEWLDASADGRWLAVSGAPEAYLLGAGDGRLHSATFLHGRNVRRARFSPDGRQLLTASLDGSARIWEIADGSPATPPMFHELSLYDATWSADGKRVATAGYDSYARLWSADSGARLTGLLRHDDHVYAAVIPPAGDLLITGSRDQKLRLWDTKSGRLAAASQSHRRSVSSLALDGDQLLVGGRHEQVRLLDLRARAAEPVRLDFPGTMRFAQSQENGQVVNALYRTAEELVLERRDIATGRSLGAPQPLGLPSKIDAAKGNDRLIVQHDARTVSILAGTTGDLLVPQISTPADLAHAEIDREGEFVFLCDTAGKSVLLELDRPEDNAYGIACIELEPFPGQAVEDVIMLGSPLQVAAKRGESIRVYDVARRAWLPGDIRHPGGFGTWDFNAEHHLLITGGFDDTARMWNASTGQQQGATLNHADANSRRAVKVKLSSDGRRAVTSSWHELGARIWNTSDGSLVTNPLYQNGHVEDLAIDPRSRYLATTDDANTLMLWSLEDGQPALPVQRFNSRIRSGRFTDDGGGFLAVTGQSALFWPLPATEAPAPDWAIGLAEAIVARHLDERGVLQWLPDIPHAQLASRLVATPASSRDPFAEWLSWVISDPEQRQPSP